MLFYQSKRSKQILANFAGLHYQRIQNIYLLWQAVLCLVQNSLSWLVRWCIEGHEWFLYPSPDTVWFLIYLAVFLFGLHCLLHVPLFSVLVAQVVSTLTWWCQARHLVSSQCAALNPHLFSFCPGSKGSSWFKQPITLQSLLMWFNTACL